MSFLDALINFLANLFSIIFNFTNIEKIKKIFQDKKNRIVGIVVIAIIAVCSILVASSNLFSSVNVTHVMLDEYSLNLNVDDTKTLNATVLYSDNTTDNNVIWSSSNQSVASIDSNGQIIALTEGSTTIIAQASKNNTTESAECVIVVRNPPSGYSISVRPSGMDSYYYIYVKPFDDDITKIQIYAESPSGEIFHPDIDENNLYHFYTETGTWTVYASVENKSGIYKAHKPEDFITIEVTSISSDPFSGLLQQLIP